VVKVLFDQQGKSIERIILLQQIMWKKRKTALNKSRKYYEMKGQRESLNRIIDLCSLPLLTNLQEELDCNTMALKALKQEVTERNGCV
jgi:NifU-like protein involved in Fe-S cluster formation